MSNNEHPWRDADTLQRLYIDEELSMADVADRLGTYSSTIKRWLDKHDIPTKTVAEANSNGDINKLHDESYLRQEYIKNDKSTYEIAEELNVAEGMVSKWLNRNGIETRKSYQEQSDAKTELLSDKQWLRQKYHIEGLTLKQIGEICNCVDGTVKYWIEKHGMETDSKSVAFTEGEIQKLEDAEWLRKQYHENELSQFEIGEMLGLTQSVVGKYMRKHRIERRSDAEQMTDGDVTKLHDREFLHRNYIKREQTMQEIADEIGVQQRAVWKWLHEFDIETRPVGARSGKNHPNYKGDKPSNGKYYGPNWTEQRLKARIRDQARCQRCGMTESEHYGEYDQAVHVHHIKNRREFIENGILDYESANALENLITLCFACHRKIEYLPLSVDTG